MLFLANYFNKATLTVFNENFASSKLREHPLSIAEGEEGMVFKFLKTIGTRAMIFIAP